MKTISLLLLLPIFIFLLPKNTYSQIRYQSEIFSSYNLQSKITYGTWSSSKLDLYTGTGDHAINRPLVIFIHGGGFKGGDKVSNFGTLVCGGLAKRGYVVASINYRTTSSIPDDDAHFEAMLKALQDAKAAVRFFRMNSSTYGIDTSQIFATGSSAGSITALHLAYLDSVEVPPYVTWGNIGGTFEGTSGNPGFSSRIHGAISNWGAIGDTLWMKDGDVPVYCVHGTDDATVYYDQIPADGPFLYGSKFIYERAQHVGLPSGLRLFYNTGHTLDNNTTKQDSAYKDFSAWLYSILQSNIGPAYKLNFGVHPSNTLSGNIILPPVTVQIEDSLGNLISTDTRNITIAIGNNGGPGGVLSGNLTVAAVSGVATFSDLSIDVAGPGYTLTASASSLVGATSNPFNILPSGSTGTITTSGSGNWGSTTPNAPWPDGIVPTFSDNVIIADGHTITIDIAANCSSLKVGQGISGLLQFEQTTPRTLSVLNDVIIYNGGTFRSNTSGNVITHSLSLAGNLINNGILDFSTNGNTAGASITFTGTSNTTFGGTGTVTDIKTITLNKGISSSSILEVNPTNFSVQGNTTDGTHMAFLTLTNGTFKISGSFTMTGRVFTSATYSIPATCGFWLNNPNFIVAGQSGNSTCDGLLRISNGVFNIGFASSNKMSPTVSGATFIFEGGITNIAGMLRAGTSATITLNVSGGIINVTTVGNAGSGEPGFGFTSTSNTINISGGAINLVQRNKNSTAGNRRDYNVLGGSVNITGGTLYVGTNATNTNFDFAIGGNIPNLVIDNTTNSKIARLSGNANIFGDVTVKAGTSLDLNGKEFIIKGNSTDVGDIGDISNNGSIDGSIAGSSLQFTSTYGQETYTGAGSFSVRTVVINNSNGVKLNAGNWTILDALTLTNGKIKLGTSNITTATIGGGSSSSFIVTDNTGTPDDFSVRVKNTFDNPPNNLNAVVNKQWTILKGTANGSNAAVSLQWNAADENPNFVRTNNLHVARWDGLGWIQKAAAFSGSDPYIASASGFTSFSPFIIECDNPLPVELLSFTASTKVRDINLNWQTKTEVNSSLFEIERQQANSNEWLKIGQVIAAGNSNSPKDYSFTDKRLASVKYHYRLKMLDTDGRYLFSDIVETEIVLPTEYAISQNYPNPFNPTTRIDYQLPFDSKVTLELYGITGEKMATLINSELTAGYHIADVNASELNLASGIYIYRMSASNQSSQYFVQVKKLILTK